MIHRAAPYIALSQYHGTSRTPGLGAAAGSRSHRPDERTTMSPQASLHAVKIAHTIAWAFFAGCILALPFYTWRGDFTVATILIAIISVEVVIILANRWRCPLTDVAARYTDDRADNFDIYLPLWLARYNKELFGSIFVAGLLYTLARWQGWLQ